MQNNENIMIRPTNHFLSRAQGIPHPRTVRPTNLPADYLRSTITGLSGQLKKANEQRSKAETDAKTSIWRVGAQSFCFGCLTGAALIGPFKRKLSQTKENTVQACKTGITTFNGRLIAHQVALQETASQKMAEAKKQSQQTFDRIKEAAFQKMAESRDAASRKITEAADATITELTTNFQQAKKRTSAKIKDVANQEFDHLVTELGYEHL